MPDDRGALSSDKSTQQTSRQASSERLGYSDLTFAAYERGRAPVRPVNREIVRWVLDTYAGDAEWLLELGSGRGELAGLLPEERRAKLFQSDALPHVLAANSYDTQKAVLDATAIPFSDGAVPTVVGYSFLNAVTDVEGVIREVARVLQRGGALLSVLDVQPLPELVMARFPADILLPAAMPVPDTDVLVTDRRYLRTDRSDLEKGLARNGAILQPGVRDFLQQYLSSSVLAWHAFQAQSSHADRLETARAVAEALVALGLFGETVDALRSFERIAQAACWSAGLRVVQSELVTGHGEVGTAELPGVPTGKNVTLAHLGASWWDTDPGVKAGYVHLSSTVHVLAAVKGGAAT